MPKKAAYQPLLPPGRHPMSMHAIRALCVTPFDASSSRHYLFAELERLVDSLIGVGVACELWVDGSFFTKKPEPSDIDLTVNVCADHMNTLHMSTQNFLLSIKGRGTYSSKLDAYCLLTFLREDPRNKAFDRSEYWAEKWGVGWDRYLKGYAVIKIG